MLTDEWQMCSLEKSEHASVAAKMVLSLSSKKRLSSTEQRFLGLRPRTGEWQSSIFVVLVPELSSGLEIFFLI